MQVVKIFFRLYDNIVFLTIPAFFNKFKNLEFYLYDFWLCFLKIKIGSLDPRYRLEVKCIPISRQLFFSNLSQIHTLWIPTG